ncbi:MAG: FAD-dependent oxidoreductase [Candidatus Omnitrophica bacterium]|nr:FAD-dependent oxidoreductase [Candidatus Omnitrophota bacterium]MBU1047080.1 FAD-dependent oxidoreductase [Candidatus Omnitrophota bacterium]MBU1630562.1 FAD-dependent oxidoreductase [Candidatus Omnitrophota bacterium]MBU1767144.1 FAD-dependent oxidoreductase [Candidatus Omnitrophota bacterium]MBU1888746.1 FAD-dependent oxidoreductase [Candidatus Omnitrophota bacterium]
MIFETEVVDIIQRTHDVKSFRFKTEESVNFKPGQFFFVTIKIDGEEKTKHFSFSNSPTEKGYIEFTKRITDSDYSKALGKLKIGDWAKLKMPLGQFTFEGEYPKIAFVSGGIGITPIRSICKFVTDKKIPTDIILLYGNRTEEDIAFRDDLAEMQKLNENLRVIYTLDNPSKKWEGRIGHINDEMIREEIEDFKERIFYICGPPKMVEMLEGILKDKLSVTSDRIKIENFSGY